MIELHYAEGKVYALDQLPSTASSRCAACAFLNEADIGKLLSALDAKLVAKELNLKPKSTKLANIAQIYKHFRG